MNVYEISVRFMRRAQVKEYEPMEAEATLKASLSEGEDHNAVAINLMRDARNTVIEAGLKSGAAKAETTATTAAASDKPQGRPKKEELVPAAKAADKPAAAPKAADKPAATKPAAAKPAAAPAPADEPETNEFGEPIGGEDAADEPEMTGKELQTWITDLITNKKIAVTQAKEILAKYGAAGSLQVKDGDRRKVVADIKALIDG